MFKDQATATIALAIVGAISAVVGIAATCKACSLHSQLGEGGPAAATSEGPEAQRLSTNEVFSDPELGKNEATPVTTS